MKDELKHDLAAIRTNTATFLKWLLFACLVGGVTGVVGTAFHYSIDWATQFRTAHRWMIFFLPLAGLVIVASYRVTKMQDDRGTEFVIGAVREGRVLRFRTAPLIFLGTVLTHLTGGSAGREGAALQLGGCLSGSLGRVLRLDDKDERIITMCGMAAGFAALFGTPLAATVFAMEVISVGVMYYAALFPCVLASLIAHGVAVALGGETTRFALHAVPDRLDAPLIARLVLFGVVCAVLSAVVCILFHQIGRFLKRKIPNQYICIAAGGAAVAAVSLLLGTRDYNGAGMAVIERAIAGEAHYTAFFIKLVLTAITIGVGYKGGEIVPVLFIGATFGAAYGGFFGLASSFAAGLGMTAVFCGVTNSPLTSILLAYELFGGQSLGLFALVISIAYMLSGYYGLYSEQKILYSKMRPQFIDRKTK